MIGKKVKYLKTGYYIEDGKVNVLIVPGYIESEAIALDDKLELRGECVAFNAENSTVTLMTENGLLKNVGILTVRILKED